MNFFTSIKYIGPVWPAMLFCFVFMAGTSLFLALARMRAWLASITLNEHQFLQRVYDATEMFSTLAILSGMIGTCLGLLDALPVLGQSLSDGGNANSFAAVLKPLRNVWVSTVVGLGLGGIWGEVLMFILKPYTRSTTLPVTHEELPQPVAEIDETALPEIDEDNAGENNLDDDWRSRDTSGMY
ncbi:MAG: hypothetical protein DWQ05_16905 [Calditrichaeota bacterium]|nr:MAG: hypothetical protein DWQ05_16905 [Calditrichota bacterium]